MFNTIAILLLSSSLTDFALLVSFTLQDLLMFAVFCVRLHLHCLLGRGGRDDLSDLVLNAS